MIDGIERKIARSLESELLGQARLLQNCVCGVPGLNVLINHKSDSRIGAVP